MKLCHVSPHGFLFAELGLLNQCYSQSLSPSKTSKNVPFHCFQGTMALRSKNIKVQPIVGFNVKRQSQEFIESEECLQLRLQNERLSCRNLQSILEESLKGTPESSKSSLKDDLIQNPVSIERIRKEVYFLRVLAVFLVVASIVSLALNIWVIRRDRRQHDDCSANRIDGGILLALLQCFATVFIFPVFLFIIIILILL